MPLADVLMVSPGPAANEPSDEVAASGVPAVAVVTPVVKGPLSSLALELTVVPAGGTTAEEPAPVVVTGRLPEPSVAAATPVVKGPVSSLALELIVVPAGGTATEELPPAAVTGRLLAPSVGVLDPEVRSFSSELIVVRAGGPTAEEAAPAVVTGKLSGLPVVVTALVRLSVSGPELDTIFSPAGSTDEDEPAVELVVGWGPAPSDDKLD